MSETLGPDDSGQAGAEIEDTIRRFLREWQESPALPSDAASLVMDIAFRGKGFDEAVADLEHKCDDDELTEEEIERRWGSSETTQTEGQ